MQTPCTAFVPAHPRPSADHSPVSAGCFRRKLSLLPVAGALALGLASASVRAQLYTTSFGTLYNYVYSNGAPQDINLGFAFDFLGKSYTSVAINDSGYVNFGGFAQGNFPESLDGETLAPMIAPFWTPMYASASGGVYLSQTAQKTVITWDGLYLSYFGHGSATFQLVLNDPTAVPVGEGTIGFFYGTIDPSPGGNGTVDSRAVSFAGLGDGLAAINPGETAYAGGGTLPVSAQLTNTHVWFNVNSGTPDPVAAVPEPETYALMLAGLGGLGVVARRRKRA